MFTPLAVYAKPKVAADAGTLLLDLYPNALGAFSLRKLRTAYTGDAIQVTRVSDSATQDIGFDANGDLDTASLASFCGASSGRVSIWYNQALSPGFDLDSNYSQAFPEIYDGTSVQTLNGKPAVYTPNGSSQRIGNNNNGFSTTSTKLQVLDVSGIDDDTGAYLYGRVVSMKNTSNGADYDNCDGFITFYANPFGSLIANGQNNSFASSGRTYALNTQYINFAYKNGTNIGGNTNGGTFATTTSGCGALNANQILLMNDYRSIDSSLNGWVQEVVIWEADNSGDRSGIVNNANAYYGAF